MEKKNFEYDWLLLSSENVKYRFQVVDCNNDYAMSTSVFTRTNYHWVRTSNTIAEGRLFSFTMKIFWTYKEKYEAYRYLSQKIKPAWFPSRETEFKQLKWRDERGEDVQCMVKVYKWISVHEDRNDIWTVTFELLSENPNYERQTETTVNWSWWNFWYLSIPTWWRQILHWWIPINDAIWQINLPMLWNYDATPVKIEVIWEVDNPKIYSLDNKVWYKLNKTTQRFVYDNREESIVEDQWINVKQYRSPWSSEVYLRSTDWWEYIVDHEWNQIVDNEGNSIISAWVWNKFIVTWENFDFSKDVIVNVIYRYNYI